MYNILTLHNSTKRIKSVLISKTLAKASRHIIMIMLSRLHNLANVSYMQRYFCT